MAEDLAAVGEDDAGLVIGFRRRPQLLIPVMEMMRSAGTRVVLVTDMSAAESPRLADKTIRCHNRGPGPFDPYAAAMRVLNLLVSEVSGHLGPEATRYSERVETVHARLGDLRSGYHTPE
ncbi:hypothetical protein CKO28_15745 [Rhodovibrio sodomensis]|uniref:SIS domain-containing protein n=1 Tax=Rhodovibrio sodomensis TaxID=1088 RepID=A0ABS1DG86_9PROT|nr:hypothetical protein [Rhodovibrio sodomensis]MBK1669492.1 hypothetical protein [Rhodovibrio sodomensis]